MTYISTSIQEVRGGAAVGAPRTSAEVAARRGIDALADVCRGLFGGPEGQQFRATGTARKPAETVTSRAEVPLAPAA